nr:hypothetical protein BaRGS_029936 [Batillaria attramentaria]
MDPNLACILRTVTYLEHPGNDAEERHMEKFWKRLELSMPKKKCTTSPDASAAAVSTIGTADVVLEDPPLNDLTKFRGQIPAETPPPAPTPTTTTTTVPIHRGEANKGVSGKPDRGLDRFVFGKFNTGTPDVCLLAVRPIDDKSLFQQKEDLVEQRINTEVQRRQEHANALTSVLDA